MKIALVVPFLNAGGVETFIFRLAVFLREHGQSVTIIACQRRGEWWSRLADLEIGHLFLPLVNSFSPYSHASVIASYLSDHDFDIVLINNEKYIQSALARLPDKVAAVPIIHIDADFAYRIGCSNQYAWNVIVGVSPKICDTLRQLLPGRPVVEVPYGVEVPDEAALDAGRDARSRPIKLLFVGRIEHLQKGVLHLPEILQGCLSSGLSVTMSIVGSGSDEARLRSKFSELGLMNHVRMCGFVPPQTVYEYLLSHHVLLMPSYFEGLPITVLEAQACGCVPVASRLPGITVPAIREGSTGLLVTPGSVEEMVDAINQLYRSPEILKDMGLQGHNHVKRHYSVEAMGLNYIDLFRDIIGEAYPLPSSRSPLMGVNSSLFTWRDYVPNFLRRIKWFVLDRDSGGEHL